MKSNKRSTASRTATQNAHTLSLWRKRDGWVVATLSRKQLEIPAKINKGADTYTYICKRTCEDVRIIAERKGEPTRPAELVAARWQVSIKCFLWWQSVGSHTNSHFRQLANAFTKH